MEAAFFALRQLRPVWSGAPIGGSNAVARQISIRISERANSTYSGLKMTPRALARSWLVENHPPTIDIARARMAVHARNIYVGTFEREIRLRLVVKRGWLPFFGAVATPAVHRFTPLHKLSAMDILMTRRAVRWR